MRKNCSDFIVVFLQLFFTAAAEAAKGLYVFGKHPLIVSFIASKVGFQSEGQRFDVLHVPNKTTVVDIRTIGGDDAVAYRFLDRFDACRTAVPQKRRKSSTLGPEQREKQAVLPYTVQADASPQLEADVQYFCKESQLSLPVGRATVQADLCN